MNFPPGGLRGRYPDLPLALKSIAGFWLLYLVTLVAPMLLLNEAHVQVGPRLLGILVGSVLTFLLYLVIRRAGGERLKVKIIVAGIACLPASAIFATFNLAFFLYQPLVQPVIAEKTNDGSTTMSRSADGEFRITRPDGEPIVVQMPAMQDVLRERAPSLIVRDMVTWYFFFAAWASFYIAMSSAVQLRDAERRAAGFERQAQAAQLRALRYQVNPHFLFNTLNSLSSLIMSRRAQEAETMIVNLSAFFRSTLAIDPTDDVTLSQEIAFQMLYLDIEKARFPARLKVDIDIPDALQNARIPALLLQPLVENAIKYGVARARDAVTLTIRARDEDGCLHLAVENDGAPAVEDGKRHGTGVGLPNVCERLAARFGNAAACTYGPGQAGGFKVEMIMPLVRE